MKTWLTLLLLSTFFTGCNSAVQTKINEHDISEETLFQKGTSSMQEKSAFTILSSGDYPTSIDDEKETTIYHSDVEADVLAFEDAYITLSNEIAPSFDGTIIIAKMGQQRTGGYTIEVESVVERTRFTEVTLHSKTPEGLATMALTNPFVIVYLPNNHKEIIIIDK